jgi:methionine-rich copper-binding protein CopC
MATESDLSLVPYSGDHRVDALLGPIAANWNYLLPSRTSLYYTFDCSTGSVIDQATSQTLTAFNVTQKAAATAILNYVGPLIGISFVETGSGTSADFHFGNINISGASTTGLCSTESNYSMTTGQVLTTYNAEAYIYLDNVEFYSSNLSPVAGNDGYETLLHEVGHALGLGHSFDGTYPLPSAEDNTNNTVMSYTSAGAAKSTYQAYDLLALAWIYGTDGLRGSYGYNSTNGPSLTSGGGTDTTAPTVTSFTPTDGTTGVATSSDIVLVFSETIARGTGSILIKTDTGVTIETFNAATSTRLSFSGSTLTIDPTSDLSSNTHYSITFAAGTIKDTAGNSYAGSTSYDFTTAASDDYAGNTSTTGTISIGGSTTGSIESSGDIDWFKVTLTAGANYVFTLTQTTGGLADPYLSLYSPAAQYLTFDDDSGGARNSRISYTPTSSGTYYLAAKDFNTGTGAYTLAATSSDTTAPTALAFSPADEAANIAIGTNVVITFSEDVQRGTGSILLKNTAGTLIETYDSATSSNLTISGTTLTINPTANLGYSTGYKVEFTAGNLKDLAGNNYAGTTSYNFTTVALVTGQQFTGTSGNDTITGGSGIDTAIFTGNLSNYILSKSGSTFTVQARTGSDGTDTLTSIERLQFANTKVAIDLDGNAGTTVKILGAIFGAASVSNKTYVGIGLTLLDGGTSYADLMDAALSAKLGAAYSNEAEINLLYQNLAGALPSTADLAYWAGTLSSGQLTHVSLAVMAADLELNSSNIRLLGLQQTGIEYV